MTDEHLIHSSAGEACQLLLKEQYHRFCNSLQVIAALAGQCIRAEAADSKALLHTLEKRVKGLAAAHRLLVFPFDNETFAAQTKLLTSALVAAFGRHDEIIVSMCSVDLPPGERFRLALLIAELVTNSLKHSLQSEPSGWIQVSLTRHCGASTLVVRDSGRRSGSNPCPSPPTLVAELASSIGGTAGVSNHDGYVARILLTEGADGCG